MAQQECIEVPFAIPAEDVQRYKSQKESLTAFIQQFQGMPWLMYLLENASRIDKIKDYNAATHMYEVHFQFHLDPKKATYYRIKYAQ